MNFTLGCTLPRAVLKSLEAVLNPGYNHFVAYSQLVDKNLSLACGLAGQHMVLSDRHRRGGGGAQCVPKPGHHEYVSG